ncbi:ankyrin repeat domain-containing protein [Streptomyces sp. NPDC060184]|uniref:ankyrin repeat domain-containing protein n=1 Tax=Streptomyces sp. NPDC060184 TaxID=3347064 RepID=UPI0036575646
MRSWLSCSSKREPPPEGRRDDADATPLMMAVAQGHTSIAEILINGGADMNRSHGVHWDAVHASAAAGWPEMVRLMHGKGAIYTTEHLAAAEKGKMRHQDLSQDHRYREDFPVTHLLNYEKTLAIIGNLLSRGSIHGNNDWHSD